MTIFLVRHGRPLVDHDVAASRWTLDPSGYDDVWALRDRLPTGAAWYSSPERKAVETAQLLTDRDVGLVDGLREHDRAAGWVEDFDGAVRRAFAHPDSAAVAGWKPLATCEERLRAAVAPLLAAHAGEDLVLVGHGTAWTILAASLTGAEPDLEAWSRPALPDVWEVGGP